MEDKPAGEAVEPYKIIEPVYHWATMPSGKRRIVQLQPHKDTTYGFTAFDGGVRIEDLKDVSEPIKESGHAGGG